MAKPQPNIDTEAPARAVPPPLVASARLTDRDQTILTALADCGFLTTRQIAQIAGFDRERRCRRRMGELKALGLVDLVARGARGYVSPAWHLTTRGQKIVPVLDRPLHYRAQSQGAPLLRLVQRASDVYATIIHDPEMATSWDLLPDLRWAKQGEAHGMRPPRPWSVVTSGGVHIALELDRPARRRAEVAQVISRWARWRKVEAGWGDAVVLYVVSSDARASMAHELASKDGWFIPTTDPASNVDWS